VSGRVRLQLTEAEIELLLELLETAAGGRVRPWSMERVAALASVRAKLQAKGGRSRREVEPGLGSP